MDKSESAVQVLGQIEALIGASTGKSVVAKIKAKIKQLKDDFNEEVRDGNYYDYIVDYCGIERDEMTYDKYLDRYRVFEGFKDTQYSLELDEVEEFINETDYYFGDRRRVSHKIYLLEELLEE